MNFNEKLINSQSYPDFQRLVLLSDYIGITLDELVKDIDVEKVRNKNINSEKLNSIYNDVNVAKSIFKWYLIIGGSVVVIIALIIAYFVINTVFKS